MTTQRWHLFQQVCGDWHPTNRFCPVTTAGSREGAEVYFRDKGMTDDLSGRVRAVLETIDADFRADRADCAPSLGAGATVAGGTATPGKEARRV